MANSSSIVVKKFEALEKLMIYLSAVIVAIMMLLTATDVFLRYVFNKPMQDSFELSQFMMAGLVFLGIPYMQSIKGHVSVEFLTSRLSPTAREIIKILGYLFGLFIYVIVTRQSGLFALDAWKTNDYTMGIVHYPLWPAKSTVPLGSGILCIRLILDIVHGSVKLLGRQTEGKGGKVSS